MSRRPRRPTDPTHPRPFPLLLLSAVIVLLVAACGSAATASPSPTAPAASAPASPSPSPAAPTAASPAASGAIPSPSPATTQTETAWGRIWDAVPTSFPVLDGASPVVADEAVSLAYEVSAPPKAVADALQADLETAAFSTESMAGPLEDGSFVITSTGDAGCRVETRVVPMGTTTRVLVRYGAACPFD
jgi:hypothetical protein